MQHNMARHSQDTRIVRQRRHIHRINCQCPGGHKSRRARTRLGCARAEGRCQGRRGCRCPRYRRRWRRRGRSRSRVRSGRGLARRPALRDSVDRRPTCTCLHAPSSRRRRRRSAIYQARADLTHFTWWRRGRRHPPGRTRRVRVSPLPPSPFPSLLPGPVSPPRPTLPTSHTSSLCRALHDARRVPDRTHIPYRALCRARRDFVIQNKFIKVSGEGRCRWNVGCRDEPAYAVVMSLGIRLTLVRV